MVYVGCMVFSHTLHSLEHGDLDLFGLVAFGQGSLHLCPPVTIGNAVISVGLPEQRENQLLAPCQTTSTQITFHACPLSMHGTVPLAVMFGWEGSSRTARCICVFILAVKIGLAGKVLLQIIHVWRIILASFWSRRATFPQWGTWAWQPVL